VSGGIEEADLPCETRDQATYRTELKAAIEAEQRAYIVEQGCLHIRETEEAVVTPAMRRIEAEDPDRHLVGLEFRLKGKDRIEEKVAHEMQKGGLTAEQAFNKVKDAIRYTFQYPDDGYSRIVRADMQRLKAEGFELEEFRNLWTNEEYKGINSRWRIPGSDRLFEVQFHTRSSFEAKQETHAAYELLRTLPDDHEEVHALRAYEREIAAKVPIPLGAPDVTVP
jgi:hypothetical protein